MVLETVGAISAIITIVAFFVTVVSKAKRYYRGFDSWTSMCESEVRSFTSREIAKIGKIAIVDDHLIDFPVKELKAAGYDVDTYEHTIATTIDQLGSYDVVLLDLHGIDRENVEQGGFQVLKSLRKNKPRQRIIAVSKKFYDIEAYEYFSLANARARKPLRLIELKSQIDEELSEKFNTADISQKLDSEFQSLTKLRMRNLIKNYLKFCESSEDINSFLQKDPWRNMELISKTAIHDLTRLLRFYDRKVD